MSKKFLTGLISIALLIVLGVAASVVSYSIANRNNNDAVDTQLAQNDINRYGATTDKSVTHIDLIIKNALDAPTSTFNVVEIVPSGTYGSMLGTTVSESYFKKYIDQEYFSQYVITENRNSETRDMPPKMISYNCIEIDNSVTPTTIYSGTTTVGDLIDGADLIYLRSPSASSYNDNNDFSNDLYDKLKVFIDKKPTIIDYVSSSSSASTKTTYKDFMYEVRKNYVKYRTYPWADTVSAENFLAANGSYFIKKTISKGDTYISDYGTYKKGDYIKASGNVLVLSADGSKGDLATKLEGYANAASDAYDALDAQKPDRLTIETFKVSGASAASIIAKLSEQENVEVGYSEAHDTDGTVLTDASGNVVLETTAQTMTRDKYDFVILENNLKDVEIDANVYSRLRQMSEASIYILFPEGAVKNYTPGVTSTNLYIDLMYKVVSNTGVALAKNVLPLLTSNHFETLCGDPAANRDHARDIADIINYGLYRDSDKTAGRKYRVLEIEPCYPVDIALAKSKGNDVQLNSNAITGSYYNNGGDTAEGMTKEESVANGNYEYYAFDFSQAKIAEATGHDYDDIEVSQMSVNELITRKDVLVDSYDMIYIGANNSALIPFYATNFEGLNNNSGQAWNKKGNVNNDTTDESTWELHYHTVFDTYTHTGIFAAYSGVLRGYNIVDSNTNSNNFVSFNGNDINSIKLEELKNYVDSGLPIIIDKDLTDLYDNIKDKSRLEQLRNYHLDPDSYMYEFLKFAEGKKTKNSVSWGKVRAHSETTTMNNSGKLGNTTTVTVLSGTSKSSVKDVYDAAEGIRPRLILSSYPTEYIQGNSKTYNTTTKVSVKGYLDKAIKGHKYKFELYVDSDGDGLYGDIRYNGESYAAASSSVESMVEPKTIEASSDGESSAVELSFDLEDGFFGLVNWKMLVTDLTNGIVTDYQNGCAFYNISTSKKPVRVLQIMPEKNIDTATYTGSLYSLYLCTDCQQASHRLTNNVITKAGTNMYFGTKSYTESAKIFTDMPVGLHEHNFGIVKYDDNIQIAGEGNKGGDNWNTNFADILTHGDDGTVESGQYEFTLDVVSPAEFDNLCSASVSRSEVQSEANSLLSDYYKAVANYYETAYPGSLEDEHKKEIQSCMNSLESDPLLANTTPLPGKSLSDCEEVLEKAMFKLSDAMSKGTQFKFKDEVVEGIGTSSKPGSWIIDKQYYRLWTYFNDVGENQASTAIQNDSEIKSTYPAVVAAYRNYVGLKDRIVLANKTARKYAQAVGAGGTWLTKNYDMVVIGFADRFGADQDLAVVSCNQLVGYVNGGGFILNTHDSLSINKESNSIKMANNLRETFGMDRFHVAGTDDSSGVTLQTNTAIEKTVKVEMPVPGLQNATASTKLPADETVTVSKEVVKQKTLQVTTVQAPLTEIRIVEGTNRWDAGLVNDNKALFIGNKNIKITSTTNSNWATDYNVTETGDASAGSATIEIDGSGSSYVRNNYNKFHLLVKDSSNNWQDKGIISLDSSGKGTVSVPLITEEKEITESITVENKDVEYDFSAGTTKYTTSHTSLSDKIKVDIKAEAGKKVTLKDGAQTYTATANASGVATFEIPQDTQYKDYNLTINNKDLIANITTDTLASSADPAGVTHTDIKENISVTVKAAANSNVKFEGTVKKTDASGNATFTYKQGTKVSSYSFQVSNVSSEVYLESTPANNKIVPQSIVNGMLPLINLTVYVPVKGAEITIKKGSDTYTAVANDSDTVNGATVYYAQFKILQGMVTKSYDLTLGNNDVDVSVVNDAIVSTNTGTVQTVSSKPIAVNVASAPGMSVTIRDGSTVYYKDADKTTGIASFSIPQSIKSVTQTFNVGTNDLTLDWDVKLAKNAAGDAYDDNSTFATTIGAASTGDNVNVTVNLKKNGVAVADGEVVSCTYRGNTTNATVTDGKATFTLATAVKGASIASLLQNRTDDNKYMKYATKAPADVLAKNRNARYFWTVRVQSADNTTEGYNSVLKASQGNSIMKYNCPLGLSDTYTAPDSSSDKNSPFRYAYLDYESFENGSLDTDGSGSYETKRGTRNVNQTNSSGLTKYPYNIDHNSLDIAVTHNQAFALDMEDPNIAVFFTLDGNKVDSSVSSNASKKGSSYFAASPKDGMNNYFMYYRVVGNGRMFYTGAGHEKITGNKKKNNDERKLFINVILSSVVKGTQSLSLRLYNKCNDDSDNCDHNYINRGDTAANAALAESTNTLYWNKAIGMYQYNVEEKDGDIYPEFDFRAFAGSDPISSVQVFYDLDYNTSQSPEYKKDANHVMITSYDKNTDMSGVRVRLRSDNEKLLLKKNEYTKNYKDYTYIVIRVADTANNVAYARIKINFLAHLFDLTDAGYDYKSSGLTTQSFLLDITDRKQFNI